MADIDMTTQRTMTPWTGWVYFAGLLLMLSGIFELVAGFTALLNDEYYVATSQSLLLFDFTTWGWVHLLIGIFLIVTGTSVLSGHRWARFVAITLASLNMIAQFTFITAYPVWSILAILLDLAVIYALTVHGGEAARP